MIETKERVIFLNKIHLFSGLKEEQLTGIGVKLEEREFQANEVIFDRGDEPDGFYMIHKGRVNVTRPSEKGDVFLAWLAARDYFGEEALFENRKRSATITALEKTTVLFLSRDGFEDLLKQYEKLKPNFQVAIKSRKLARSTKFKWLGPKEVIYFIARRHRLRLLQALLAPLFSTLIPLALFGWGYLSGATTPFAVGALLLVLIAGWALWNWIDWSNDYYIVTNQRVIWLEKVIGLYDSRQEAPLGTILSVGVETDVFGRAFDFGNVIVRTFVGKVEFDHVDHPNQAADMIREYWDRTKAVSGAAQKDVMKNTIRQKLGLPVTPPKKEDLPPVVPEDDKITQRSMWTLALRRMFQLRVEEGGTIIYHKHWIIYLQQTWRPILVSMGILAFILWRLWFIYQSAESTFFTATQNGGSKPDTLVTALLLFFTPFLGWMIWEYVDWKNDVFMVTTDEIFDVDRKPLGKEERRAAQIENILSTSYKRNGLIANVFNYGTVNIVVGGTQLDFQDVLDPASVQADINRRRMTRIAKKNEDAGAADRERFATWLVAYHQNVNEFNAPPKGLDETDKLAIVNSVDGLDMQDFPVNDEDSESGGEIDMSENGYE